MDFALFISKIKDITIFCSNCYFCLLLLLLLLLLLIVITKTKSKISIAYQRCASNQIAYGKESMVRKQNVD